VFEGSTAGVAYADPWTAGFAERRLALLEGSPRIAYYYALPDTSIFRYRVFNMIEALGHMESEASASWLTAEDEDHAIELIDDIDVLVVCRALYAPQIGAMIARAKALGKRVLFDIDDLVFDDRYTHLIVETLDQPVDEAGLQLWFGRISRCGATLRLCDGVVTTNDFLAERVRQFVDLPTWVVPNFLNAAQLELSARIRRAKGHGGTVWTDRVYLGYFSGTPTHNRDFAVVEPAVERLLEEDPRIKLRIVGFPPQSERLERYGDRIETLPLQDFLNLQLAIGEVDINLVPLRDNVFTNCKSDLKYFEAAIAGTVTVATPTYTFDASITDGVNGFTARSDEWYAVLRETIDRLADLPTIAENAVADVLQRYTPAAQASALRAALID
jgi:glycosyltransferase involved in cell wall biosynthesis